jgi:hypothetical protein
MAFWQLFIMFKMVYNLEYVKEIEVHSLALQLQIEVQFQLPLAYRKYIHILDLIFHYARRNLIDLLMDLLSSVSENDKYIPNLPPPSFAYIFSCPSYVTLKQK